MIYALDTEFLEDGKTIDLLSIAIVAEDGREFYAQNLDCDISKANVWVVKHVYPHLVTCPSGTMNDHRRAGFVCGHLSCPWLLHADIGFAVQGFIAYDPAPIFWGYYSAYDWVALCQLFGSMVNLPKGWPMYCRDLRQWLDGCGREDIRQPDDLPHNALFDARYILQTLLTECGIWRASVHGEKKGAEE